MVPRRGSSRRDMSMAAAAGAAERASPRTGNPLRQNKFMRIAHLVCTFPPYQGGMGNSVHQFAKAVAAFNHKVSILTPRYSGESEATEMLGSNLEVRRLKPLLAGGNAAICPQLWAQLKQFDIVHLHYPWFGSAEIVALYKLFRPGLRLVLHYHMDCNSFGLKGVIFKFYQRLLLPFLLHQSTEITAASLDYLKNSQIRPYLRFYHKKITQVPFGVDLEKFTPAQAGVLSQTEVNKPTILFVGGMDKQHYFKGVDNLIKSFIALSKDYPTSRLLLLGNGDLVTDYKKLTAVWQVDQRVDFWQNADEAQLLAAYQQATVLVLPSINQSEAFGLVLLEAMACAKPVIASNLPGVRSVFKNYKQGLLVQPGDVNDLTDKLKKILANPQFGQQLGEAGRQLVEKNYTWQNAGEKLNEIYYRVQNSPQI